MITRRHPIDSRPVVVAVRALGAAAALLALATSCRLLGLDGAVCDPARDDTCPSGTTCSADGVCVAGDPVDDDAGESEEDGGTGVEDGGTPQGDGGTPIEDGGTPQGDGGALPVDDGGIFDGGAPIDSGGVLDGGDALDAGGALDAGDALDGGDALDAGGALDGGALVDAGVPFDAGPACAVGACPVTDVATGETNPTGVLVHDGTLYWVNNTSAGCVRARPADLGTPARSVSCDPSSAIPFWLVVEGDHVYWTSEFQTTQDAVRRARTDATTATAPETLESGLGQFVGGGRSPVVIGAASGFVVWLANGKPSNQNLRMFNTAAPDAGVGALASNASFPEALAVVGGPRMVWTEFASTGNHKFWSRQPPAGVLEQGTYAGGVGAATVVDGSSSVYIATKPTGTVNGAIHLQTGGGAFTKLVDDVDPSPDLDGGTIVDGAFAWALALDATYLYWITDGEVPYRLYRAPRATGVPELLRDDLAAPGGVAVDDAFIYFTEWDASAVRRMQKPAP